MAIIIIEGVDKTFKSTTAKKLLELLSKGGKWEAIKGEHPETLEQVLERAEAKYKMFEENPSTNYILDRFEPTSDPIYRDLGSITVNDMSKLNDCVSKMGDVERRITVFLHVGDTNKIAERFNTDKEEFTQVENIQDIQLKYMLSGFKYRGMKNLKFIPIEVEDKTTDEIVGEYLTVLFGGEPNTLGNVMTSVKEKSPELVSRVTKLLEKLVGEA